MSTISPTRMTSSGAENGMPTSGESTRMMRACRVATVAPPAHLPSTSDDRRMGATSISRRKPNSRSHTIDTAEKMAEKRTVMATMPGKMKVRKLDPEVAGPPRTIVDSPVPSTNKNSTGWAREVRIRSRLRPKRMSSRRQTMRTARSSSRAAPPARRTAATSCAAVVVIAGAPPASRVTPRSALPTRPRRRGWSGRCAP